MKRFPVLLAIAFLMCISAKAVTYKVVAAYLGTTNAQYQLVWGNRKIKVDSLVLSPDSSDLKVYFKNGRVDEYSTMSERGDASYQMVSVHEKLNNEGWEVTDFLAQDDFNHSCLVRKCTNASAGKTQFFIFRDCVYGFDVEL